MALFDLPIVAWRTVSGQEVTTNGVIEEALGLTPHIAGWCKQGFYISRHNRNTNAKRTPEELDAAIAAFKTHIKTIDWARVQSVDNQFAVKMDAGAVCWSDSPVCFVTETRFQRLIRNCFKSVPPEKFRHEVDLAKKICKESTVSGSL